jgi:hypothetical protein
MLALVAATLLAVGTTLQHAAAGSDVLPSAPRASSRLNFLVHPKLLAGLSIDLCAYGFEIAALDQGRLTVVEPLLALGMVFALPMSARLLGVHHSVGNWFAALAVTGGVTATIMAVRPLATVQHQSAHWPLVIAASFVAVVATTVISVSSRRGSRRSIGLSLAAGITYGLTAALTKAVIDLRPNGIKMMLVSWQTGLLAVGSLVGLILSQLAFRGATLSTSLPTLTVSQRVIGAGLGVVIFGDRIPVNGIRLFVTVASMIVVVVGIAALASERFVTSSGPSWDAR